MTLKKVKHHSCVFYDTVVCYPEKIPDLAEIDEIIFTSPSTVDAFVRVFGGGAISQKLTAIGPITQAYLQEQSIISLK